MQEKYPTISVLVLCYNNQKYIYESLQSVFSQTYPNIEVLIADDASASFNAAKLVDWINKNKTPNIKKIVLYENPFNYGTVASLEHLQQVSTGEYLFHLAADDVLYDSSVLQAMVDRAAEIGEEAEIIMAETEMWDSTLTHKLGDFLKPEGIRKIENCSSMELFAECSWHPFLPACYLYRRSVLNKVGSLSEKYTLVEDWPFSLIITRMGIKPYICNIPSSIKHRDGGISHGNDAQSKQVLLTFCKDLVSVYNNEVEPYLDLLSPEDAKRATQYAQDQFRAYFKIHIPDCDRYLQQTMTNNVASIDNGYAQYCKIRAKAKKIAHLLQRKKVIFPTLLAAVLLAAATFYLFCHASAVGSVLCLYITVLAVCVLIGEIAIRVILSMRRKRQLQKVD